jgi:CHAT domain
MRTITLELLRHGPAHNQLLSPLTQYLALCENHSAVTVHVPFEHNQFLYRHRSLSYSMGEEPRIFQVRDTAQVMGDLLSTIPGLTAAINGQQSDGDSESVTHLRLVLSAAELALLPFELALAPHGFPGAGQPLLLQSQMPLCITRETRRVPEEFVDWPKRPKILFVTAAPPGYPAVPAGAHLLALRKAIEPWIGATEAEGPEKRRQRVDQHLSVLTHASAESIEAACASGEYTHIHILAHGHEQRDDYDVRFGLALHNAADASVADIVSGERLATALRVAQKTRDGRLARPAVVTLASCNSGNVGSVAGAGASIAHALHEAGVPMIIASQFPLSYGGSVRLVEVLYQGLLWGEDPRNLLMDLRRQLHTQFSTTHDWASVTAYASLPPDFDEQLASVQIQRVMNSINVALHEADEVTRRFSTRTSRRLMANQAKPETEVEKEALLRVAKEQVARAKDRLEKLLVRHPAHAARIRGLLASTEKREAEIHYAITKITTIDPAERDQARRDMMGALERAREHYWNSFLSSRANHWAIVQFLSLTLILNSFDQAQAAVDSEKSPRRLWALAETQSLADLHNEDHSARKWAIANLIELYLLAPLVDGVRDRDPVEHFADRAQSYANELRERTGSRSFEVFSTRRQIARYLEWFNELAAATVAPIYGAAEAVFGLLPESEEPDWGY